MCLQIEACDDTGGNTAWDISDKSHDVTGDSHVPAVQQVNNFRTEGFYDYGCFQHFLLNHWFGL